MMHPDKKHALILLAVIAVVAGGLLVWRFNLVPEIGKFFAAEPGTQVIADPQYIFVRKDDTCSNCILWNDGHPENYTTAAIDEIINTVGTRGTPARRLGVGALFEPNLINLATTKQSLQNLLVAARVKEFPIYLSLDSFDWWDGRPDLWYWWEPGISTEEKARRIANVEWTDWDGATNEEHVPKLSWRNWGFQLRTKPHPNLLSPAYIGTSLEAVRELVPLIVDWYNQLPVDKKYLLGGVDFGNEVDIGANFYYYPNGNSYLDKDPANDPNPPDFLGQSVQIGFAALKTGGIRSSGTITTNDLNEAVRRYLHTLTKEGYELGLPRNKIFNHTGGGGASPFAYPSYPVFSDLRSSVMPYAYPGWSFYGDVPANPDKSVRLNESLDSIGNTQWAVPEWLTFAKDYDGWLTAIRNSLNYRNNTFINVANWEQIREQPYALEAIRTALGEQPACRVTNPIVDSVVSPGAVMLSWSSGTNSAAQYLNIATDAALKLDGTFEEANITNSNVTGQTTFSQSNLAPGTYHWLLASDGCQPVQRHVAYGSFTVTETAPIATVAPTTTIEPTATTTVIATATVTASPSADASVSPVATTPATTVVAAKPGDLDGNGQVDIFDYNLIVSNFGKASAKAGDADGDGDVDIFDYNVVVSNFGK